MEILTLQDSSIVVDLSYHDYDVDPGELERGGVRAVILAINKGAWDGTKYLLHPNCVRILNKLKSSNILIMTYLYYYTIRKPISEANWFVDTMFGNGIPAVYAWADCEDHSENITNHERSEKMRMFTAQVAARFDKKVGVYASKHFGSEYAIEHEGTDDEVGINSWLGKYKAWIPHWKYFAGNVLMSWEDFKATQLPTFVPYHLPSQVEVYVGHQFTGDRYHLPGVLDSVGSPNWFLFRNRPRVDVSLFKNSFIAELTGSPLPPPPPVPPPSITYRVTNVPYACNVRSAPYVAINTWVRYAYRGETVELTGIVSSGYAQLVDKNWIWAGYLTKA